MSSLTTPTATPRQQSASAGLGELPTGDPVLADAWLRSLEALGRLSGLKDTAEDRQVTDLFMASAGVRAFAWAAQIVWPRDLAAMRFCDIRQQLAEDLATKRLSLLANQAEIVSVRQAAGETVRGFAARLGEASADLARRQRDCGCCERCAGDLTLATLIGGLRRPQDRDRLMERVRLAGYPVSLASVLRCIEDDDVDGEDDEAASSGVDDAAAPMTPAGFSRWWRRYSRQQLQLQQRQASGSTAVVATTAATTTTGQDDRVETADGDESRQLGCGANRGAAAMVAAEEAAKRRRRRRPAMNCRASAVDGDAEAAAADQQDDWDEDLPPLL